MDICTVTTNKIKESGLVAGDVVMVAGTKVLPEKRNDPYLQRIYTIVFKFEEGSLPLPKDDNDVMSYLVDPRNLEKVNEEDYKKYSAFIGEE